MAGLRPATTLLHRLDADQADFRHRPCAALSIRHSLSLLHSDILQKRAPLDLRSQLEQSLAGAYTIERELGRGGMATVFLARDNKHHRSVALKVLHPHLAHALGAERFLREIELSAGLNHPHILTVLDSGHAEELLWFTMPFVEGETLRERLNRERQLPLEDALRITREAADALHYAHRHGIVHRDIKPENILLTESHALVADFGIGKALGGSEGHLTETGLVMGTAAYMSPEQATGEKEVGPRSDIYSLGTVLYEMLAGETPFDAPTAQGMLARRLTESPRPVREIREAVPPGVALAIDKALSRLSADRFATAAEFAHALSPTVTTPISSPVSVAAARPRRRIPALFAMLLLGVTIGLGVLFAWRGKQGNGGDGVTRLAVLPFENLGDSADAYFAEGMTDEVRGKLSGLPKLQVTARQSTTEYRGSKKPLRQIGEELGVRYLLTATVRWEKTGNLSRVRVTPELVDVSTSATRWQQPFDANLTDVFQVQGDIATQVAQALDVELTTGEQQQLAEKPTSNLAAYDAFLRGEAESQEMSVNDPPSLRRALPYYERAIALDSSFALAWSRAARVHELLYANSVPLKAEAEAARVAAERAVALAPARGHGHLALAGYYRLVLNDPAKAAAEYAEGLRLEPGNLDMLAGAAANARGLGLWDSALAQARRITVLNPRSALSFRRLCQTALLMRRYPEAQAACDRALALAPQNLNTILLRVLVSAGQGDLEGTRRVLRSVPPELDPGALVAYVANFEDMFWVLDQSQQEILLRLPPASFDDDRGAWAFVRAQTYWLRNDSLRTRAYADTAANEFAKQLRDAPDDPQRTAILGVARALQGRKSEAEALGERATALFPLGRDTETAPYLQFQLVRIYLWTGSLDKALDKLEPLLRIPYYVSPGRLRIDPQFAPLKGNPRFERLAQGN